MGNPERAVMDGLSASAWKSRSPVKPLENTASGSLMRTVGPLTSLMVPAAISMLSM